MFPMKRRLYRGPGHSIRTWPVLVLLLLLILVPTICVLWFMNEAVNNEHLAIREKLRDAYRGHLTLVRDRLEGDWKELVSEVDRRAEQSTASTLFASCIRDGLADSVLCYDAAGHLTYPVDYSLPSASFDADDEWQRAYRLEHLERDFAAAAKVYRTIAEQSLEQEPARPNLSAQVQAY
jgi:hypothetical protein